MTFEDKFIVFNTVEPPRSMLNVQRFILIFLSVMMKCADSTGKLPGHGRPLGAHMKPMGVTAIGKFSSPQVFYGHFVKASRPIHMKSALTEAKHPGLEWTDEYLRFATVVDSV